MSIQKKDKISKGQDIAFEVKDRDGERDSFHTAILVILILIFTGLSGFALGKLDGANMGKKSLRVDTVPPELLLGGAAAQAIGTKPPPDDDAGSLGGGGEETTLVVGSKNSNKYHFPWCSGAKRIKAENIVSFTSFEAARAAGYGPASNCPGLQ